MHYLTILVSDKTAALCDEYLTISHSTFANLFWMQPSSYLAKFGFQI
jgi:hypothetical protein